MRMGERHLLETGVPYSSNMMCVAADLLCAHDPMGVVVKWHATKKM